MTRKKKPKKKNPAVLENALNLPTVERLRHGGIVLRSNKAQAVDPLRIDKLLKNAVIDEMQHLYGIQIITLWNIASRPFLKAMQYEPRTLVRLPDFDHINLTRMGADDQFYKTMSFLKPRDHELICRICFKEQGAIEAGRSMGLPINGITSYVRAAFDALGNALSQMRDHKRTLEKQVEDAERSPTEV
jgi:hypothetical protein